MHAVARCKIGDKNAKDADPGLAVADRRPQTAVADRL